jgi:AcrR family transcriptional regulator
MNEKGIDKRIVRTRKWLSQAFLELLKERGFQAITVQDITERAAVNRATFYAHYEDKYHLFNSIIDETFQQRLVGKVPTTSKFNLVNLRTLILVVFEYLRQLEAGVSPEEAHYSLVVETRVQYRVNELILDWLRRTNPEELKWSMTPEITAAVISWAIFGAGLLWSREGGEVPPENVADNALLLIAGGLYGRLVD